MSESGDGLDRLLRFISETRGIDFAGYKRTSLSRRIHKRMGDVGAQEYDDYSDLLETNSDEFRFLLDAVLINVTEFLRDARAWEYLRAEIVPDIVERAARGEIRMWSAGCSSGQEACSLAMIFAEVMGVEAFSAQVKIYATDIDEDALREARHGTYPAKSLEAMPADLAERYFEPSGTSFAFRPDLRPTHHLRPPRRDQRRTDLPAPPPVLPQHDDVLQRRDAEPDLRSLPLRAS